MKFLAWITLSILLCCSLFVVPSYAGVSYANATLSNMDFSGQDLRGADFSNANLAGASFVGANLSGAVFANATLTGAMLTGANLTGADMSNALLNNADLRNAVLAGAQLVNASMNGAHLDGADFTRANLTNAGLGGASTQGGHFDGAVLTNVDTSHIAVIAPAVGTMTQQGKETTNQTVVPLVQPNTLTVTATAEPSRQIAENSAPMGIGKKILLLILGAYALIYAVAAFISPILAIVRAIGNNTLSKEGKMLWIVGVFFFLPCAFIYMIVAEKNPSWRFFGKSMLICGFINLIGLIAYVFL